MCGFDIFFDVRYFVIGWMDFFDWCIWGFVWGVGNSWVGEGLLVGGYFEGCCCLDFWDRCLFICGVLFVFGFVFVLRCVCGLVLV